MLSLKEIKIKKVIADTITGVSKVSKVKNLADEDITVFVRHLNLLDQVEIEEAYEDKFNVAIGMGIPTQEEQLASLIRDELWSPENDEELNDKRMFLDGLRRTRSTGAFLKSQFEELDSQIKATELEINKILARKAELIGDTAETFASKHTNDLFIFKSVFKDPKTQIPLFSEDQFNELDDEQIISLNQLSLEVSNRLNEKELKRAALCPYFYNIFSLSDNNPQLYFGRPVSQLTFYQAKLFHFGCYFKGILSEVEVKDEYLDDPDKLISFYESSRNVKKIMDNSNAQAKGDFVATGVIGMTKEDQKNLNLENSSSANNAQNLLMEKVQKQGRVGLKEILEIHHPEIQR